MSPYHITMNHTLSKIIIEWDLSLAKFTCFEQAQYYAPALVALFDRNFSDYQNKPDLEAILRSRHILSDGRAADLSARRNGTSVVLLDKQEIIWISIGVQEKLIDEQPTSKWFFSHLAVDEAYRGKNSLCLIISTIELLLQKWCTTIVGATSTHNDHADRLYSKAAINKYVHTNPDWSERYKYEFRPDSFKQWKQAIMGIPKYKQAIDALLSS